MIFMSTLTFLKLGLQLPETIQGLAGHERENIRIISEGKRRLGSTDGHLQPDVGVERGRRRRRAE